MSKEQFVLFNIRNNEEQNEFGLQLGPTIPAVQMDPTITLDRSLDIGRIADEIFSKTEKEKQELILNIQVRSNEMPPLINENELAALKALGIKVVFSFEHYDSRISQNKWISVISNADHVFFARDKDREDAVSQKHIVGPKASYVLPFATLKEAEILSRKPNIFMSEGLENNQTINEVVGAAKELPGTKVIMAVNTISQKSVTNAIAARFGISDQDQLVGITLEVESILQDKMHGPKNLEAYISQLNEQFKQAGKEVNPVEIYCDFSNPQTLQNLYKQAKYTISPQGSKEQNFSNGCIPLARQGGSAKEQIISELNARERDSTLNKFSISDMQMVLNKTQERTMHVLHSVVAGPKVAPKLTQPVLSKGDSIKQPDYLYYDSDILTLLQLSLDKNKVTITPPTSLHSTTLRKEELLESIITGVTSVNEGKEATVMPIETGAGHWVCLAITKDKKGQMVFTYNDPNGMPIDVRQNLVQMIKEIAPEAKIVDLQTKQQQNDKDCGPFVVDNLVRMAKGQPILDTQQSKDAGGKLRAQHAHAISVQLAERIKSKQTIAHSSPISSVISTARGGHSTNSRGR